MSESICRLLEIMTKLRSPKDGCPWDIEQTFETIAPYTIEEAYEVADAIERNDLIDLKDELGDLLFQVVFHAQSPTPLPNETAIHFVLDWDPCRNANIPKSAHGFLAWERGGAAPPGPKSIRRCTPIRQDASRSDRKQCIPSHFRKARFFPRIPVLVKAYRVRTA